MATSNNSKGRSPTDTHKNRMTSPLMAKNSWVLLFLSMFTVCHSKVQIRAGVVAYLTLPPAFSISAIDRRINSRSSLWNLSRERSGSLPERSSRISFACRQTDTYRNLNWATNFCKFAAIALISLVALAASSADAVFCCVTASICCKPRLTWFIPCACS